MKQYPDDYECDGQIDIWEWMEEKESQNMTREEANKELERAFDVLDRTCHMDNRRKEAFNVARKSIEVVGRIERMVVMFAQKGHKPSRTITMEELKEIVEWDDKG